MSEQRSQEVSRDHLVSGYTMILISIALLAAIIFLVYTTIIQGIDHNTFNAIMSGVGAFACIILLVLSIVGMTVVEPNMSRVLILFGKYKGSIRKAGFFWVNPFSLRRKISLRVRNFNSDKLKVNDLLGNPIEIGAVIVWKVKDTSQAAFDVEDFKDYVQVQTESAIRQLAANHPYDAKDDNKSSLRGSADQVNAELKDELTDRLALAGIEILEVRLSHLAYAPEIAGAMLQRQQAEAIISARTRIVDGAVGMVEMALDHLKERGVVDLDEERKASMVSNLLVVLCSERGSQPVVNAGSLYT